MARRTASLAALALATACSGAAPGSSATITVGRQQLAAAGVSTVGQALREAGVSLPGGELLSLRTHRPLRTDGVGGVVLVDGRPAEEVSAVRAGEVISVESGGDRIEPAEVVTEPVLPNRGLASLRRGGRPGELRVVRGAVSHEVVSSQVVVRPYDGRLLSPSPVALTFDDGPSPQWTPPLLRLLAHAHVHATFCLVGRQAAKYPALVRAIVAGGHTLCNHTWDHDERLSTRSPADVLREITRAQAAITSASGGVAPAFFRAPGGAWSPEVESVARSQHLTPLMWDVDPRDWARPGTPHVIGAVVASIRPGSIVLLHDGGGKRDQTVAAVSDLLVRLPRYRYQFQVPQPV